MPPMKKLKVMASAKPKPMATVKKTGTKKTVTKTAKMVTKTVSKPKPKTVKVPSKPQPKTKGKAKAKAKTKMVSKASSTNRSRSRSIKNINKSSKSKSSSLKGGLDLSSFSPSPNKNLSKSPMSKSSSVVFLGYYNSPNNNILKKKGSGSGAKMGTVTSGGVMKSMSMITSPAATGKAKAKAKSKAAVKNAAKSTKNTNNNADKSNSNDFSSPNPFKSQPRAFDIFMSAQKSPGPTASVLKPSPYADYFAPEMNTYHSGHCYLNTAGMSAIPIKSMEASRDAVERKLTPWEMGDEDDLGLREEFAKLLLHPTDNIGGVRPVPADSIAINPSTAQNFSIIAHNLREKWLDENKFASIMTGVPQPKTREILLLEDAYCSSVYCWQYLCGESLAELVVVPTKKVSEDIEITDLVIKAYKSRPHGAVKVVSLPQCLWTDGSWVDLERIIPILHKDTVLCLDLTQSLGVVPVSPKVVARSDVIVSSMHKWLCSLYGHSLMYVNPKSNRIVSKGSTVPQGFGHSVKNLPTVDTSNNNSTVGGGWWGGGRALPSLESATKVSNTGVGSNNLSSSVDYNAATCSNMLKPIVFHERNRDGASHTVCLNFKVQEDIIQDQSNPGSFDLSQNGSQIQSPSSATKGAFDDHDSEDECLLSPTQFSRLRTRQGFDELFKRAKTSAFSASDRAGLSVVPAGATEKSSWSSSFFSGGMGRMFGRGGNNGSGGTGPSGTGAAGSVPDSFRQQAQFFAQSDNVFMPDDLDEETMHAAWILHRNLMRRQQRQQQAAQQAQARGVPGLSYDGYGQGSNAIPYYGNNMQMAMLNSPRSVGSTTVNSVNSGPGNTQTQNNSKNMPVFVGLSLDDPLCQAKLTSRPVYQPNYKPGTGPRLDDGGRPCNPHILPSTITSLQLINNVWKVSKIRDYCQGLMSQFKSELGALNTELRRKMEERVGKNMFKRWKMEERVAISLQNSTHQNTDVIDITDTEAYLQVSWPKKHAPHIIGLKFKALFRSGHHETIVLDGSKIHSRLKAAKIHTSLRSGKVRVAFYLYNSMDDVTLFVRSLRRYLLDNSGDSSV